MEFKHVGAPSILSIISISFQMSLKTEVIYVLGVKKMEPSYLYIKSNLEMCVELISREYLVEGERRGQIQL